MDKALIRGKPPDAGQHVSGIDRDVLKLCARRGLTRQGRHKRQEQSSCCELHETLGPAIEGKDIIQTGPGPNALLQIVHLGTAEEHGGLQNHTLPPLFTAQCGKLACAGWHWFLISIIVPKNDVAVGGTRARMGIRFVVFGRFCCRTL
ncbi:hypothetical protein GCM10008941_26180 [Rhizomicrobium palustre]